MMLTWCTFSSSTTWAGTETAFEMRSTSSLGLASTTQSLELRIAWLGIQDRVGEAFESFEPQRRVHPPSTMLFEVFVGSTVHCYILSTANNVRGMCLAL
jgi:hypothetical protein